MHKNSNYLDTSLISEVEEILDNIGLDVQTVIKMLFEKIACEQDISFLLPNSSNKTSAECNQKNNSQFNNDIVTISKTKTINHFKNLGYNISKNVTFSSKNRGSNKYWANPEYSVLEHDWYLILNDWTTKKLHLFIIPKNSIHPSELVYRNDKRHLIDIQILYDDSSFLDTRSQISFSKYLIKTINYH